MKKFILLAFVFLLPAQTPPNDNDMKVIRNTGRGTLVYRFDDGANTCYVTEVPYYTRSTSSAISCVKRYK